MTEKRYTQEATDSQVSPSSAVLNLIAEPINPADISSPDTQDLIDRMLRVAYGRQGDAKYPTLVGLAAPQIGVSKRAVVIGINAVEGDEQPELCEFINPEIVASSGKTEAGREGCFSTSRVCGIVERVTQITVKAFNRDGDEITHSFEGFPARVAQHEIDHLNGIRFPDRIKDDTKLHWVEEEEFGEYRAHWQEWSVLCPREKWDSIKSGQHMQASNT